MPELLLEGKHHKSGNNNSVKQSGEEKPVKNKKVRFSDMETTKTQPEGQKDKQLHAKSIYVRKPLAKRDEQFHQMAAKGIADNIEEDITTAKREA